MSAVQFIQTTPEQLQDKILQGVKRQIEDLKKTFQPKEPNEYLTRNEVAAMLKIDLSTLHNWTKSKRLRSYGIGGRVYYKRAEVEEAIVELNN